MKSAAFQYHAPGTRAELLTLLAELDDARVIAGGQSLVPMMNLRLAAPEHLIDLNGLPELDGVELVDGSMIVGAMTRQRAAERSALVAQACPLLAEALQHVGFQQTRNRGTIGGSIAHMDPTAELPVVAQALDAVLGIESRRGDRRLPFDELSAGYLATQIESDEVLVRIEFPCWPQGHGWGFDEVTRRGESFSIVSVAALVTLAGDGTVARAAIAIGGLSAAPLRLSEGEAALQGQPISEAAIAAVAAAAGDLPADGDHFAPAAFKLHLAQVLVGRTLQRAAHRARSAVHG